MGYIQEYTFPPRWIDPYEPPLIDPSDYPDPEPNDDPDTSSGESESGEYSVSGLFNYVSMLGESNTDANESFVSVSETAYMYTPRNIDTRILNKIQKISLENFPSDAVCECDASVVDPSSYSGYNVNHFNIQDNDRTIFLGMTNKREYNIIDMTDASSCGGFKYVGIRFEIDASTVGGAVPLRNDMLALIHDDTGNSIIRIKPEVYVRTGIGSGRLNDDISTMYVTSGTTILFLGNSDVSTYSSYFRIDDDTYFASGIEQYNMNNFIVSKWGNPRCVIADASLSLKTDASCIDSSHSTYFSPFAVMSIPDQDNSLENVSQSVSLYENESLFRNEFYDITEDSYSQNVRTVENVSNTISNIDSSYNVYVIMPGQKIISKDDIILSGTSDEGRRYVNLNKSIASPNPITGMLEYFRPIEGNFEHGHIYSYDDMVFDRIEKTVKIYG